MSRLAHNFILFMALLPGLAAAQAISITSTSRPRPAGPYTPVPQQKLIGDGLHVVLPSNDLGMHCDNLDTRIAQILPPFNVLHAQVVAKGNTPSLLGPAAARVVYSAASAPKDPALATNPVLTGKGGVYKTNFGATLLQSYTPLYPPGLLAPFYPTTASRNNELGLPVPDLETLYLGSGALSLHQQTMPDVTALTLDAGNHPTSIFTGPYRANRPQTFQAFEMDWPLFTNFPFGYAARGVNWFAAEGIPITEIDDAGRINPFPLMRVQAISQATGKVMASTDVVVPVSAETNCKSCHLPAPYGSGIATGALARPATPADDPAAASTLPDASAEWAANINTLRLHDLRAGTKLYTGYNRTTGLAPKPVVCQTCHYSPALDLAQLGPGSGNGLQQTTHESNSRVMHAFHGALVVNGQKLFPDMPPPNDPARANATGNPVNDFTNATLQATCYQCHPGKRTECLRGTMFARAGAVCQDCHGQMAQVGDDFSKNVKSSGFLVRGDYYTNAATPRVPWANEPTCGSCHTGDAASNMTQRPGAIAAPDSIRLIQAYLSTDSKATPILPDNTRFSEPRVTTGSATGNPLLFRLSKDSHGGIFCEGCHGPTHAEWPVLGANANDNVTPAQLQGHGGMIVECGTCHTGALGATLKGPHGLHPVGAAYSAAWVNGHGEFVQRTGTGQCAACHGLRGEGTVLAKAAIARPNLPCEGGTLCGPTGRATIPADTLVDCAMCHRNPL